jgi:hypothetical protein
MSAYNPPVENTPIFNSNLFSVAQSATDTLTTAELDLRYLKFPTAQGAEALQAISVSGTASFTNTANPTSTATQPAPNDSSTKIPTTAWVQSAIAQYLQPITQTAVNVAKAFYPPTPYHLKASGYIIAQGGSAGTTNNPDSGTWTLGGAGGGGGGVSFINILLANDEQFLAFNINAFSTAGSVALSYQDLIGTPMCSAVKGGNGGAGGTGGGSGGTGSIGVGFSGATFTPVSGTAGANGTSFSNTNPPLPAGGTNSLNTSYGFGQRNQALIGFTSGGYVNVPAGAVGQMYCSITWVIPSINP